MSAYHIALGIAALVALALAYKTPRAVLWIGLLATSFVVSVAYLRHYEAVQAHNIDMVRSLQFSYAEWLPPSIIAAVCDATICIAIRYIGREKWETRWLYGVMLVMVATNLVYASGVILRFPPMLPSQDILGIWLEIVNYLALALIGGTGVLDRLGAGRAELFRSFAGLRRILVAGRNYLHQPAPSHPFWKR